jgi:hypothetical protein
MKPLFGTLKKQTKTFMACRTGHSRHLEVIQRGISSSHVRAYPFAKTDRSEKEGVVDT